MRSLLITKTQWEAFLSVGLRRIRYRWKYESYYIVLFQLQFGLGTNWRRSEKLQRSHRNVRLYHSNNTYNWAYQLSLSKQGLRYIRDNRVSQLSLKRAYVTHPHEWRFRCIIRGKPVKVEKPLLGFFILEGKTLFQGKKIPMFYR